jgi:predicted nucleic acid-binding protein
VAYLVDTSILARIANSGDAFHSVTVQTIFTLHRRGEILRTAPQNIVEFRSVATRPVAVNGLGLTPAAVNARIAAFETAFPLLPETPDIYSTWKELVESGDVVGKQVHDARLVAICQVYGITHLLTFNVQHFTRLASLGSGLVVVEPSTV